jgi:hypothetical protein
MLECSPPARRRRAALEADGSGESLLSEETSAENAWPRAKTADGGRSDADQSPPSRHFGQPERHTREITRPVPP